jgi:hypothetical protein
MSYETWFQTHAQKHNAILQKLTHLNHTEVITYFSFENMVQQEPNFCPLYATHTKCHSIETLNCYLCGCPHFRFHTHGIKTEEGKTRYSHCAINAKEGKRLEINNEIHQDCSDCTLPHQTHFVKQYITQTWEETMQKVHQT